MEPSTGTMDVLLQLLLSLRCNRRSNSCLVLRIWDELLCAVPRLIDLEYPGNGREKFLGLVWIHYGRGNLRFSVGISMKKIKLCHKLKFFKLKTLIWECIKAFDVEALKKGSKKGHWTSFFDPNNQQTTIKPSPNVTSQFDRNFTTNPFPFLLNAMQPSSSFSIAS